jgi:hypothetical protein
MGEKRVDGEGILGKLVGEETYRVEDDHLSISRNVAYLYSYYADKLKYVHREPFGYNKCKLTLTPTTFSKIKNINGDKKYD